MSNSQFDRLIESLLNTKERASFAALSHQIINFLEEGLKRAYEAGDREGLKELLELVTAEPRLFLPSGRVDYLNIPTSPQGCRNLLERAASILLEEMARRFFAPYAELKIEETIIKSYCELKERISRFIRIDCANLLLELPRVEDELLLTPLLPLLEEERAAGAAGRLDRVAELLKEGVMEGLYESRELREALFKAVAHSLAMEQCYISSLNHTAAMAFKNRTLLAAALLAGLPPYLYSLLKERWPFNQLEEEEVKAHPFKPLVNLLSEMATKSRNEGLLALEEELEDIDEPLLRKGVQWMVDGLDPVILREMLESSLANELGELKRRGELIIKGLLCLQEGYNPRVIETTLTELLSSREQAYYSELKARFELGDPVNHFPLKGLEHLILYIISLSEMARREGLLSLEPEAEESPDPLTKLGLLIILEGTWPALVEEILTLHSERLVGERALFGQCIVEGIMLLQAGCPAPVMTGTLQQLIPFFSELGSGECPASLTFEAKVKQMEQVRKRALGCSEPLSAIGELKSGERLEAAALIYLDRPLAFYKRQIELDYLVKRLECELQIASRAYPEMPAGVTLYSLESLSQHFTVEKGLLQREVARKRVEREQESKVKRLEEELKNSINSLVLGLEAKSIESPPQQEQLGGFIKELSEHYRRRNEQIEELNRKSKAELSQLTERYIGELHNIGRQGEEEPEAAIVREMLKQGLTDLRQVHAALNGEEAAAFMHRILNFEDLALLSDREIQLVLREIDIARLAQALKGAPDELLERVLSNMGSRGATLLKEEIEFTAPLRLEEIREARDYVGMVVVRVVLG